MKIIIGFILLVQFYFCPLKLVSQVNRSNIVITYITSWGKRGEGKLQFNEPNGISVSPEGNIYIADTGNQRIQKLTIQGEFIKEVGGYGWGQEEFDQPVSLDATNGLDVYVADYNNHRIERYDKDLNYLASFFTSDDVPGDLQLGYPLDVNISNQGEIFCLDGDNIRILKLNIQGEPQLSFADFDAGVGRLYKPGKMCIVASKSLYVSDLEKKVIMGFDIYGNYMCKIGAGILQAPYGIANLDSDYLMVTDYHQKVVFIFNLSGQLITQIDRNKYTSQTFNAPVDVCSHQNKIFVLDKTACKIDIFHINFNKGQSEE